MKKTAVEWLIEQCPRINTIASLDVIEQAKEMERDQIVEAFGDGAMDTLKLGKEYYNYLYTEQ
jgi:hypothetical protein